MISLLLAALLVKIRIVTWDKSVFLERKKFPITFVKLFGMEKVSGITKKKFKIGTLQDFEKTFYA